MESYIHLYETNSDFTKAYNGPDYKEPWLSLTEENMTISYNKPKLIDFSTEPLTFNILSDGTINWTASDASIAKTIDYKLNNGKWTSITSNTDSSAASITVNSGDKIQFRGNNEQYATHYTYYNSFSGSTALFEVEGNIMSLIYGDDFTNSSTISSDYTFFGLFRNCAKLVSAENLVLPATTLSDWCYSQMFGNCTSLTAAPQLPATTLTSACYYYMFSGCTSLNYIKCLATDVSASNCTKNWVNAVASKGTFVKNPNMASWPTGYNGIPLDWTVQNA